MPQAEDPSVPWTGVKAKLFPDGREDGTCPCSFFGVFIQNKVVTAEGWLVKYLHVHR